MRFADAAVAAAIRGARAFATYPFPGREGVEVAVRLLTDAEVDGCRLRAFGTLQTMAKAQGWDAALITDVDPDLADRLKVREVVAAAMYDPATTGSEAPVRFFSSAAEVAKECDATTVERLMSLYVEHQDSAAPLRSMTDAEVQEFVEALGNGQRATASLAVLERNTLSRLLTSMACALRSRT